MDAASDSATTTEWPGISPRKSVDPLSEEELRAHEAEPLPSREAMSTLIWAPAPGAIVPPVDGIVGGESV